MKKAFLNLDCTDSILPNLQFECARECVDQTSGSKEIAVNLKLSSSKTKKNEVVQSLNFNLEYTICKVYNLVTNLLPILILFIDPLICQTGSSDLFLRISGQLFKHLKIIYKANLLRWKQADLKIRPLRSLISNLLSVENVTKIIEVNYKCSSIFKYLGLTEMKELVWTKSW